MPKTAYLASASSRAMFHAPSGQAPMIRGPQVAYSPDDVGFSVEQAAEALRSAREAPTAPEATDAPLEAAQAAAEPSEAAEEPIEPEAEPPPAESEAEPTAEDLHDPEEPVIEETETPEPESDPPPVAIAAPRSWDATERALFATLPPPAQEIILKRETERDRAVSKAQQEAGEARKTAEADLASLAQIKSAFDEIATRANQVFADRWSHVDWVALADSDPAAYNSAKARYDAEQAELQKVQAAQADAEKVKQHAQQVEFQNWQRAEAQKLVEIAPQLADPKTGKEREVRQFLRDQGIPDEVQPRLSAIELLLASEAFEYRKLKAQGQAARTAKPAPSPAARPAPAPARAAAPSAAPPTRPTQQRTIEAAKNRFAQTGSTEDAVAVLRASRGAR